MENILGSTIGDFFSQNIYNLFWGLVVSFLGFMGFMGWRWREMKADIKRLDDQHKMPKIDIAPTFNQQLIFNQNGNIRAITNESDNVIGKQDGNYITFGTIHGPISVSLIGGTDTTSDLVKWLHNKNLLAPLAIDNSFNKKSE